MSPDVFTYMSACFAVEMGVDEDSFTVYDVLCKTKVQQHSKEGICLTKIPQIIIYIGTY